MKYYIIIGLQVAILIVGLSILYKPEPYREVMSVCQKSDTNTTICYCRR